MKKQYAILYHWAAALAVTLLSSGHAYATLGEQADSIETDRGALSAARKSLASRRSYRIEEIQTKANRIREYVSASGVVFAVAWSGLRQPELSQLLGSYFNDYDQEQKLVPTHTGRRSRSVQSRDIVVETWGHMRNQQGHAYISSLLPSGVNIDEIK